MELASALEWFLPEVLAQRYEHWEHEALDGVFPHIARRIGQRSIELAGMVLLIDDQRGAPFHGRMSHSPDRDEVEWMECRVGEPGEGRGGLSRVPLHSKAWALGAQRACERPDEVDWVYTAEFGAGPDG